MSLFDTGVIPIINDHLTKLAEEERDYGDYWPASSAGYCYRRVIFKRLNIPEVTENPRKQRVFSSGHVFHEWIQRITRDAGVSVAQELELQDEELMIRGHVDDLVLIGSGITRDTNPPEPDGKLILYDYKTAHSKWFEYAKTKPMSYYHRLQIGTYMYLIRKASDPVYEYKTAQLTEARRLAISKDDLRLHEQQLLWNKELEQDVSNYWVQLRTYWQKYQFNEQLPPCECHVHEINSKTGKGFMADEKWNDYFYNGEPCSEEWFKLKMAEKK